jgi:FkbM family methyltransferase
MNKYENNQERTRKYLKDFNREKVLKLLVKADQPIVFDVGANVGDTLVDFKEWWPNSKVHCFEPQHECWKDLEEKVTDFCFTDVYINKYAVGNTIVDHATFYSHDITSGQSGFNKINTESLDSINLNELKNDDYNALKKYKEKLNHEREVKIVPLVNYMNDKNVEHLDLLKIDTQGYEPEVLNGLENNLSKVDVVIAELMLYDFYERSLSFLDIEKYLIPAGFHLYDISHISKNPMNGRTDWVDVVYVNNKMRTNELKEHS